MKNEGDKDDDNTSKHHDAEIGPRDVQKDEQVKNFVP